MDSVFSLEYHARNVTARRTPKITVLAWSGTPTLSVRLSVTSVPKTLTSVTVVQYRPGAYRSARNWKTRATTSRIPVTIDVPVSPKFRFTFRKSAADSPTVVQSTLMTQNQRVTSGTLLRSRRLGAAMRCDVMTVLRVGGMAAAEGERAGPRHVER